MLLVKAGIIFGYITNMVVTVAYVEVRDQCHLFGGGGWPSSHSLLMVTPQGFEGKRNSKTVWHCLAPHHDSGILWRSPFQVLTRADPA